MKGRENMAATKKPKLDELMYKGKPIVRRNDKMYYGFIDDDYIVEIVIKDAENVNNLKVASEVSVQLVTNKTKLEGAERIIKSSKKPSLYAALDLGSVWLEDAVSN